MLKTSWQSQTDSCWNVIISTKWCQVQMALSCPTTIPVEFSTLEISSGTTIQYCPSIKRSKLPGCKTKPPSDRASGLLLTATIKAGHSFSPGSFSLPPPSLAGARNRLLLLWPAQQHQKVHGNKVRVCAEVCPTFFSTSQQSRTLSDV